MVARDYQADAAAAWSSGGQAGTIVLPTGAGKTITALQAAASTRGRVLVLVHTRELRDQWIASARRVLPSATVGPLTPKAPTGERISVALVQGLARLSAPALRQLGKAYELLIVDEAHHAAAPTWARAIKGLRIPRRLGLTATPERADGRTGEVLDLVGEVCAEVAPQGLERDGAILRPEVRYLATGWAPTSSDPRGELARSPGRNAQIVTLARKEARSRCVLVLVERVDHVDELVDALQAHGVRARALHGQIPADERRATVEATRRGRVAVLVATSVADEALDVPCLDTVILAVPSMVQARTAQRIGRILRPARGKRAPRVWDLLDRHPAWIVAAEARDRLYLERGWHLVADERPARARKAAR
jgi:superfamily II DNA or RNA helicase